MLESWFRSRVFNTLTSDKTKIWIQYTDIPTEKYTHVRCSFTHRH